MGKISGINGVVIGKVGNAVYASVKGSNIVRQYNPNVTNPQTDAQIAQRAKFKLINQVAASVAPFIAIKSEGLAGARNLFVSVNSGLVTYQAGDAYIALPDMQFTKSTIGLCSFSATRADGIVSFKLAQDMHTSLDAVAYLVLSIPSTQEIIPYSSVVTSEAGTDGDFSASCADPTGDIVVFAYGMRFNSKGAYNKFGQLNVSTADALAHLATATDFANAIGSFTQTRGFLMADGDESGEATGDNSVILALASYDARNQVDLNFNLTGAGSKLPNTSVTVTAPTVTDYEWVGWYNSSRATQISENQSYTFTITANTTLVAVYRGPQQSAGGNDNPPDNG